MVCQTSHYILEDYLIFKILKEHPKITPYEVGIIMAKAGLSIRMATVYDRIRKLMNGGYIIGVGIKYVKHGIDVEHGKCRQCKRTGSYFKRGSKILELSGNGYKKLMELDFRIRICLSLTVNGVRL